MTVLITFIKKHWLASAAALAVILAVAVVITPSAKNPASSGSGSSFGVASTGIAMRGGALAYDSVQNIGAPSIAPMPPESYPSGGKTAAEVDQKIIKTGNLTLEVSNVTDAVKRITDAALAVKGFVQASSVSELGDGTHSGNITVRVPAAAYESTLSQIRAVATVVKNESSTGQDVTEQYTDLQARLRNAKAQEQTYLEVLRQAKSVEDILKVQERLGSIRAEIESMQGRIQYLDNVTSYSTIYVSVEEAPTVRAPTKGFRPLDIARNSIQTLVIAFQNIASALIVIIIVGGGILLPLGLIAWLIYRLAKRRRTTA